MSFTDILLKHIVMVFSMEKGRYEYSVIKLRMSLLGAEMDAGFESLYAINPATQRTISIEMKVITGESVIKTTTKITPDTVWFSSPASGVNKAIPVDRNVIITSQTWYPHLYNDFIINNTTERSIESMIRLKENYGKGIYQKSRREDRPQ